MSTLTTNYHLIKPEPSDLMSPTVFDENFDLIDAALSTFSSGLYIASTSYPGSEWTSQAIANGYGLQSVCYGAEKYLAIWTGSRKVAISSDGVTWSSTAEALPSSQTWQAVCYGGGKYVAVAASFQNIGAYSSNGTSWTAVTIPELDPGDDPENPPDTSYFPSNWNSVCYGGGKFVAVGEGDYVAYSSDGITWTSAQLPRSKTWKSVCYGGGKFVAISSDSQYVAYSANGTNWGESSLPSSQTWQAVCYGGGKYVAVASSGQTAYSTDAVEWTSGVAPSSTSFYAICYANDYDLFIGISVSGVATTSTDGITWEVSGALPNSSSWQAVCSDGRKIVAIRSHDTSYQYAATSVRKSVLVDGLNQYVGEVEAV